MATNVSERIRTLQEIRRIIAILAVAGVVKDTIDLNYAITPKRRTNERSNQSGLFLALYRRMPGR